MCRSSEKFVLFHDTLKGHLDTIFNMYTCIVLSTVYSSKDNEYKKKVHLTLKLHKQREEMQSAMIKSATYCLKIDVLLNKAAPGKKKV